MFNALQEAKQSLINKLGQMSQTTIQNQKPGGLLSPVPQQVGTQFNTSVPIISNLKMRLEGRPQVAPSMQAQPSPSPMWDTSGGTRYKSFDNEADFNAMVQEFGQMQKVGVRQQMPVEFKSPSGRMFMGGMPSATTPRQEGTLPVRVQPMPSPSPMATQGQVMGATTQGQGKIDAKVKDFLETKVFPITRQYGIPDAVAAGQFAAEGRFQGLGAERNNFFNINAVDHNPNLAHRYETPEQGIEAYASLIKRKYGPALTKENIADVLAEIENLGYAGDPRTYRNRANNGFSSYAQFIQNVPEYRYYAQ